MVMTQSNPARPGTLVGSLDSSPRVKQVSHPQNAKIEPVTPITKAPSASPVNGLNHSRSKLRPAGASPAPTCTMAATAKASSTTIWNPTSTYCTCSLVVIPRLAIAVARARNTSVVTMLISLLSARSAIDGLLTSRAMNR